VAIDVARLIGQLRERLVEGASSSEPAAADRRRGELLLERRAISRRKCAGHVIVRELLFDGNESLERLDAREIRFLESSSLAVADLPQQQSAEDDIVRER
jgi:hypothetical protein